MERVRRELAPAVEHVAGLHGAAERMAGDLAGTREAIEPLESDVADVRDAVEPVKETAERVGRVARRLPGASS